MIFNSRKRTKRNSIAMILLVSAASLLVTACSSDGGSENNESLRPPGCYGKCDSVDGVTYDSPYVVDIDAANQLWPGETPVTKVEELFTVQVVLNEGLQFAAPTHLFGVPVNVIPYSNEDNVTDAEGQPVERGDDIIAEIFPPGEVGFAVKHHRPEHRLLEAFGGSPSDMKEHLKLQDTHIEIVVGVMRDGQPGAITVNNPQSYENGLFGSPSYPMIFVRPVYPEYLLPDQKEAFKDNIRTMALGFNAVSEFPGNYNGGDPLAANSPEKVLEHTAMMIRGITGDATALAWFDDPAHQIYCAELAHIASSAGLLVPLNEQNVVPLVGQETWDAFQAEVEAHNAGDPSAFTTMNDNERVSMVELALAPADLEPCPEYAPEQVREAARQRLAFQPMTMADIVEQFLRTHVPREIIGEQVAPAQGAMLEAMKPGLFESMGMDALPVDDPRRVAVEDLFNQIVQVVSTPHEDYWAFRDEVEPLIEQARQVTGPRDDTGAGLFVPPSLLHVIAQGKMPGGLLGLEYLGHGLHYSIVKLDDNADPEQEPDPAVDPSNPFAATCKMNCGGAAADYSCYCDEVCAQYGDCCDDIEAYCGG